VSKGSRVGFLTGMHHGLGKGIISLATPAASGQQCFWLTTMTHAMGEIPHVDCGVVKYAQMLNRALRATPR